jgi:hypothetical protein
MGRSQKRWGVVGSVSRHNDPRDEQDDDLWDEMISKLHHIAEQYEGLVVDYFD